MKIFSKILLLLFVLVGFYANAEKNKTIDNAPLLFAQNKGQWSDSILYAAELNRGNFILERNKFSFFMNDFNPYDLAHKASKHSNAIHGHIFKINFQNALPCKVVTSDVLSSYRNYFQGSDPKKWASKVSLSKIATYKNLYHHIDLEVKGDGTGIEYQYVIHKGGNPVDILQTYEGLEKISIKGNEITYNLKTGSVKETKLQAFQTINGEKKNVACIFKKVAEFSVQYFFPNGYDLNYDLIIDPTIVFSSYTGANSDNWGYTATYGKDGSMYVGGYVNCTPPFGGYPTTVGAFQTTWGGGTGANNGTGNGIGFSCDMGITKFSPNGTTLVYSTYLGGSDNETPHSLIEDNAGNLAIYGVTYSGDYPTSSNAFQKNLNSNSDIVVTKLNASGTALIGSTYLGGSGKDGLNNDPGEFTYGGLKFNYGDQNRGEVNTDNTGNIYVASCTESGDFPVTSGAFQSAKSNGQDGCVFKLNGNCSQLLWSSYLGGSSEDAVYSVEVAGNGSVYVAGGTMSSDFPTRSGALNGSYLGGTYDGFVANINANGTQLLQSSMIGTSGNDQVFFVKLDSKGFVYVLGQTTGAYPVINAPYSNANSGQFITKLNSNLGSIVYSTTFGNSNGNINISPTAFLVDTCENVYVAGWGASVGNFGQFQTDMTNMPLSSDALQVNTDGTDFYFFVLGKNAQNLLYASYFGGNGAIEHVDGGTCRFDSRGVIYEAICAGCGGNSLTPTTAGVWSTTNKSGDGTIGSANCNLLGLKMDFNLGPTSVTVSAFPRATGCVPLTVQFQSVLQNVQNVFWDFRDGNTSTLTNPVHTFTDTGKYNVMLIGTDPNSCNERDTAYVEVWVRDDSLTADFEKNTVIDCLKKEVNLNVTNYTTTQYSWNLGDGDTSNAAVVKHTYATAGTYTISLLVSDTSKCNLQASFSTQVTVPPIVGFTVNPTDTVGCIPLTVNFGNVTNSNGSFYWDFGDGDSSRLKNPKHTYTKGGYYTATAYLYDSTTCNKYDTIRFQIFAIDSFADASFTTTRKFYNCDSVQIKVESFYAGEDSETWNFGDGFISRSNPVSHTYIAPAFDTITHILYDHRKVCKPIDTVKIIISLTPLATSVEVPDTIGCVPFTAELIGKSPLLTTKYYWFFPNGDTLNGDTVQYTFQPVGTYKVLCVSIDSNSCVNVDSNYAYITVIDDSARAFFDINIVNDCDSNFIINLKNNSTNAVDYFWDFGNGNTSTSVNPTANYTLPGAYTITLWATDTTRCHPRDSISKTIYFKPNSIIDFTMLDVCFGQTVNFKNLSNPAANYVWQFGDSDTSHLYSPTHLYGSDGTYTVQLSMIDTSTCNVFDTLKKDVIIYAQPIAAFSLPQDTFKFEYPVSFTNLSHNFNTSVWNFGDGTGSDETSPTHVYDHSIGWETVCLEVYNFGAPCRDTICDSLFIDFKALIGVPNAFSPNGDGINDIVYVEGRGIIELEFRIYNRWGQLVFLGTDQKKGWDGTFKGTAQEMEVYTYTVDAKLINTQNVQLKGNITLLR